MSQQMQPLNNSTQANRYTRAGMMTTGSRGRRAGRVRNAQQLLTCNDDELPDLLLQYGDVDRPTAPLNARAFATLNACHDRL